MASNTGKGKNKKGNKKTIPLSVLLSEDSSAPQGFNVVNTRKLDWAESMDEDLDDKFTLNYKRTDTTKVLLPTAPKATRGPDIDLGRVPNDPPFKAYLGNLPYDVSDQEITRYFSKFNIKDVRLPTYNGRQRGFAYAEFEDRQSLIDALAMNGDMFRNRQLKVGLPGDGNDNSRDSNREERQDRTVGDWRTAPREEDDSRDSNRDTYQSYNSSRNGSNDNSMQRNRTNDSRSFGRNQYESDRTFRPSNDRGFDRSNNHSNDRGFDRPNDRGFDRFSDRQNNDRGFDRSNNRYNNRTDGYDDSREQGFESNERSYGRRNDDSNRYQNRNFTERRNENRREFGGGFERRERDETQFERSSPQPPRESGEDRPRERPKLQLQPRSKPLETSNSAAANSAIFGGAKPVDTAAREQEIEQKLLKEKEESDKKRDVNTEERTRRISASSNHSANSRSRKGSDSGRDLDDNYRNGSRRNRKTSERSNTGSNSGSTESAPKFIMTRNKDDDSTHGNRMVSVRGSDDGKGGVAPNRNYNNNRRKDREREPRSEGVYRPPRMNPRPEEGEEKPVAYTTSNKFAHLATEDYEDDGANNASD